MLFVCINNTLSIKWFSELPLWLASFVLYNAISKSETCNFTKTKLIVSEINENIYNNSNLAEY